MDIKNQIKTIRNHIANANLEIAIKELQDLVSTIEAESIEDSVVLLSSRFNSLTKEIRHGLISSNDKRGEFNRVAYALLTIINEIEEGYASNVATAKIIGDSNIIIQDVSDSKISIKGDVIDFKKTFPKYLTEVPSEEPDFLFINRNTELEKLHELNGKILITGVGGIGKTSLLKRYLKLHEENFNHIVWINNPSEIRDAIIQSNLLRNIRIAENDLPNRILAKRVREKLLSIGEQNGPCLFIVDQYEFAEEDFESLLPDSINWKVIVTSRYRPQRSNDFIIIQLNTLSRTDSIKLFNNIYNKEVDEKLVEELVGRLEGMPLLIQMLSKSLQTNNISLDQIKNFDFSSISQTRQNDSFLSLILDNAIKDFDEGEKFILYALSSLPDGSYTSEFLEDLFQIEEERLTTFRNALRGLIESAFLIQTPDNKISISHQIIKEWLSVQPETNSNFSDKIVKSVSDKLKFDPVHDNLKEKLIWIPYGEVLLDRYSKEETLVAPLLRNLGILYIQNNQFLKAQKALEESLRLDKTNSGPNHPSTIFSYLNLGLVFQNLGKYEKAQELIEKALELNITIYGSDHPNTIASYTNLASVFQQQGRYEKAQELIEKSLELNIATFGPGHPNTISSYTNLALVLRNLGELRKAQQLLEKTLEINISHFGSDHPSTANIFSNLAIINKGLGNLQESKILFERALISNERIFGENHPNVALTKSNLAVLYQELGDYENARILMESVVNSNIEALGQNSPGYRTSLVNLANVYKSMGEYEEAEKFLVEALSISRQLSDISQIALISSRLGDLYIDSGDFQKAINSFKEAIDRFQQLASDPKQICLTNFKIANAYKEIGDLATSKTEFEKTLNNSKDIFPSESPFVEEVKSNLAQVYLELGMEPQSEELWEQTLKPIQEAKVIFIGDSNHGKTHLVEMLIHGEIKRDIKTTHGIERRRIEIPYNDNSLTLNIWDLGGQDFMHTTHQFFFSTNTLYVLVTEARREQKDLKYWLGLVEQLANKAPVLVVVNKIDTNEQHIDQGILKQDYPNIHGFVRTSIYDCKESTAEKSINSLRDNISRIIADKDLMPSVFRKQKPGFFAVKNSLERLDKNFITYQEYEELKEISILSSIEKKGYLELLNVIGTVCKFCK